MRDDDSIAAAEAREVEAENHRRAEARAEFRRVLATGAHLRAARRAGDRVYRRLGGTS